MLHQSRTVSYRYLNKETFNLIRNGYFAIYKRTGLTSAEELEELKCTIVSGMKVDRAVEDKKYLLRVGHGGTLDNMATGVLAVGICDGCKVLPALLSSNKRYTVTGQLGLATDTFNNLGNVVAEASFDHITKEMLEKVLKEYEGEIWQKPPVYSALKIKGQRASDISRSGGKVNLVPRPVICYAARCVGFEPPFFTLEVCCGQGFYVRSLINDVAEALGSCATVTALVRTKHGPFTVEDCVHPENYSREAIVTAIQEAHQKYPQLFKFIEKYHKDQKEKEKYRVQNKNMGQRNTRNKKWGAKT